MLLVLVIVRAGFFPEQQPQVGAAHLRRVRAALVDRDSEDAAI